MARPQPLNDKTISLGGHTDIGTIAMLLHVVGGFQVLPAGSENISSNWRYVLTAGGLLCSNPHRIVTPPGKQANCILRSLVYLVRPDHNGSMYRLQSTVIAPLAEDEEIKTRSIDEWATWKAHQVIEGKVRSQTRGGRLLAWAML
ncbi:putative 2og-fe oxygenase protein [Botrytis fragariae]|uniref:Putative 2og-fe oxygenase protein n=1 Tax=Botrytis fragariae TaxID=1964551 RepID=A0A8H6ATE5_9HELO|nr:putative 2og-fe oxygenase protein [Botrytis fragariae]KAF5873261.1 putative 2og-fe oxygenase protein [Botrytis fragariae]